MKYLLLIALFTITSPLAAVSKISVATVDFQKALTSVAEGKNTKAALEKEAARERKKLEKQAIELKKMEKDIQALATSVLSDAAKMKKGQEFQQKYLAFKQAEQQIANSLKLKEQEGVEKVFRKLRIITKEMAKKKKFDLVIEANSGGLLYAVNSTDITDEIIVEYDKRHRVKK